jgi:hypothetical protein
VPRHAFDALDKGCSFQEAMAPNLVLSPEHDLDRSGVQGDPRAWSKGFLGGVDQSYALEYSSL